MKIGAQLGLLRGSCHRGHMQAVQGSLSALSRMGRDAISVKSICPRQIEMRGHAQSAQKEGPVESRGPKAGHSRHRLGPRIDSHMRHKAAGWPAATRPDTAWKLYIVDENFERECVIEACRSIWLQARLLTMPCFDLQHPTRQALH